MKKMEITPDNIIPMPIYERVRLKRRQEMIDLKRHRRVPLGPEAMMSFENYETLLWQVHEMLYIEKGGDEQLQDELLAYNPLIPQGQELVSTFMIEIDDPVHRAKRLAQLGSIDESLQMRFAGHVVKANPEGDIDRNRADGKTSAVHFLRWPMTPAQIKDFLAPRQDIILESTHPHYPHKVIVPEEVRLSLAEDFDLETLTERPE